MSDSDRQANEPTREQLEAHVVAMLLGETSSFEEAQLRERLRQDEQLTKFSEEIQKTLSFVSESFDSGQAKKTKPSAIRLNRARRRVLKKKFSESSRLAKREIARPDFRRTLWAIAAVLALLFVVFGVIFPSLSSGRVGIDQLASAKTTAEVQSAKPMANQVEWASDNVPVTVTTAPAPMPTPEPATQPWADNDPAEMEGESVPDSMPSPVASMPQSYSMAMPVPVDQAFGVVPSEERPVAAARQFATLAMPDSDGDGGDDDKAPSTASLFVGGAVIANESGATKHFGFSNAESRETGAAGHVELFESLDFSGAASARFGKRDKLEIAPGSAPSPSGGAGARVGGATAFDSGVVQHSGEKNTAMPGYATGGLPAITESSISDEESNRDANGWYYQGANANRPAGPTTPGQSVTRSAVQWDTNATVASGGDRWSRFRGGERAAKTGELSSAETAMPMGMMGGFGGDGFGGGKYAGTAQPNPAEGLRGDVGGGAASPAPVARPPRPSAPQRKARSMAVTSGNAAAGGRLNWAGVVEYEEDARMAVKPAETAKNQVTRYDREVAPAFGEDNFDQQSIRGLKADLKSNLELDDYARVTSEEVEEEGQSEVPMLGDVPINGRMFRANRSTVDETKALPKGGQAVAVRGRASSSTRLALDLAGEDELGLEEVDALSTVEDTLKRGEGRLSELRESAESGKDGLMREAKKPVSLAKRLAKPQPEMLKKSTELRREIVEREKSLERLQGLQVAEPKPDAEKEEPPAPAKSSEPSVVYTPKPETVTSENAFSTFSLNVSDVSFKTALASLQSNKLPEPSDVRSEEFLNALEYRDPMPRGGEPVAFHWERARSPFAHDRDIVRFSVKTAALGRQPGRAVNLVCLLDNSGSMEREDRVSIVTQALSVLARKLTPSDRVSLITFSRTPQLRIDGMRGGQGQAFMEASTGWKPQGGTHVENGLALAYATARKHFVKGGNNRVILLTDGAANMGNVNPYKLKETVEANRKQGIALDCFGIGWEGYNDNLLEVLARNGDGRYGFLNQPGQAVEEFEKKLLGAFQVAASDVKVQVEWNEKRVKVYRQVGYLRHQLKKEDFRNNRVDAAEISAAESGNAMYVVQVDAGGEGPLGVVRVRYKKPFTSEYTELEWSLAYEEAVLPLGQSSTAMKMASVSATFAEWLARNPYSEGVQLGDLQGLMAGLASVYGTDPRPAQLEEMIRKARILSGN